MASRLLSRSWRVGSALLRSERHSLISAPSSFVRIPIGYSLSRRRHVHTNRLCLDAKKEEVDQGVEEQSPSGKESEQQGTTEDLAAEAHENGTQTEVAEEPESNVTKLKTELAERDETISQLHDKNLRVLAEMENVRMIAKRDVSQARQYGISEFAKSLLTVADTLNFALKAVPPEKVAESELLKGVCVGVEATEKELQKVFSQYGVTKYGAEGDPFDPNLHQAMFKVSMPDKDPGTVISVTKIGYMIGERVLRPAEVGVNNPT